MKNKKGQLALLFSIPGIIVMLIAIAAAILFVVKVIEYKFIILGSTLLIMSSFYGIKHGFDKTSGKIVLAFGGVGLIILMLTASGVLQAQIGSSTFVNPDWARLECSPTDSYEGAYSSTVDNTKLYKCNYFTEECRVKITNDNSGFFAQSATGKYAKCDIAGNNCGQLIRYQLSVGETKTLPTLHVAESYKFTISILDTNEDLTTVDLEWKPWQLYRFVGGAKFTLNSANCDISSSLKSNIRNEDYPGSKLYRQGGEGTKWINYVNAWNYGPATNVFIHSRYGEVYCNAGQIFDIVELKMKDGNLKKINPEYSETLPDGDIVSGQGSKLSNVECCPNEPNCGSDFKYKQTATTCFTDSQCTNAGGPLPISSTQYKYFKCENSECVEKGPITVECTSNAGCSNGQICDLSTMNYGNCISSSVSDYCGDGKCDVIESKLTCPTDCIKGPDRCGFGQHSVVKNEVVKSWYNYIGIGDPEIIPYDDCVADSWVVLVIFGSFMTIIILGGMIIYKKKSKIKKKKN